MSEGEKETRKVHSLGRTRRYRRQQAMTSVPGIPQKLWPIGEVSSYLGISDSYVRQLERDGRITSMRTRGGHRRFTDAEVQRLRASMSIPHKRDAGRAVAYLRTSLPQYSPNGARDIDHQRSTIARHLQQHPDVHLDPDDIFVDYALGADFAAREGLRDLLHAVAQPEVSIVLVASAHRLGIVDLGVISEVIRQHGKDLVEMDPDEAISRIELEEDFSALLTWLFRVQLNLDLSPATPAARTVEYLRLTFSRFIRDQLRVERRPFSSEETEHGHHD